MKNRPYGFTLIELLIVVAIIAILAGLAVPSFTTMMMKRSVQGAALSLVSDLRFARSEALRRSISVSVCSLATGSTSTCSGTPGTWENGWMVFADTGGVKGNWEAGEEVIRVQQPPGNIATIRRPLTSTLHAFTYEANGIAKAATETLIVKPSRESSSTNDRVICISITGRPSLRVEGTTEC